MKKHVMMTFLMALTLLISPLRNLGGLTQVSAEEKPGADLYSVSGNAPQETQSKASDDLSQEEAVQLDTPTDLCWGDNTDPYRCRWNGVNASTQEPDGLYGRWYHTSDYRVELSRDGQRISSFLLDEYSYVVDWESEVETDVLESMHSFGYASTIFESGSYRFRVQACAQPGDQVYRDSEWSEWSDSIEYVRPEQEVESIELYWDEQQAGLMHFACPKDKEFYEEGCHYQAQLYKEGGDGAGRIHFDYWLYSNRWNGQAVCEIDFSDWISEYGEGKYYVEVTAYSGNIDVIANRKGEFRSDILDTTVNAEKLGGILSSATDKSAVETAELLTSSATSFSIQQAMQTSDSFREQVKDLESRYAAEQNIKVTAPTVSDAAQAYVEPGKVSLVGAALNAAQGQDIGLQMDATVRENQVPVFSGYKKSVQLDIRLVSGGAEVHDLTMPVSVTMPVPQGIAPSSLVILHYQADGTAKYTAFHVNGDGTITFTVTGFSTFVFADNAGDTSGPAPGQNANSGSPAHADAQTDLENQIAAAAPGATVKVAGEYNINALSNSVMQQLVKRGDVALEMEYTYEGTDYHVIIPVGMAVDDDTSWYGPLYLAAYYSAAGAGTGAENSAAVYIVQGGDTLGKIARNCHTTVARLAAANPQIKNVNHIRPGQIIHIE